MACGTPVIVSENTGAREAVTEGETGWVVPTDDVDALAEQMKWCVQHPDQVETMRSSVRDDAEDYSWERYHNRAVSAYRSLVLAGQQEAQS